MNKVWSILGVLGMLGVLGSRICSLLLRTK
jgi:hypothetical protein